MDDTIRLLPAPRLDGRVMVVRLVVRMGVFRPVLVRMFFHFHTARASSATVAMSHTISRMSKSCAVIAAVL